tara:strand:+ start:2478 stop:3542 length:1065 start_codon:yes stop_codon:yes gene_type:complete
MSVNTYQQCRLYIGDKEYTQFDGVSIMFPGTSKINSARFTLNDSDFQESKFINKEVKIFLNYGTSDNVPIFRGFIRQFTPSDKNIKITAYDGRTFIQGKESQTISLTDFSNYDGYTVAQYLSEIIQDKVNLNDKTYIGLSMLNDVSPPVLMKGVRGDNQAPYNLAVKQLKDSLDKESINDGKVFSYNIDMIDDGVTSNIVINKDKSLDSEPSVYFAYLDGIEKYNHKFRTVPSFVTAKTKDGKSVSYQDGNLPVGIIGSTIKGNFEDTASATEAAFFETVKKNTASTEITLTVNKAFDIALGSIVKINVPEEELSMNTHRVISKSISYSTTKGTTCNLKLNREPVLVSDYVNNS